MSSPNENQKIFTVNDSAKPDSMMIRHELLPKGEGTSKGEALVAQEYLVGAIRKRDEALSKIEEILDQNSFDYDFDAPTVVDVDLIRVVLAEYKEK